MLLIGMFALGNAANVATDTTWFGAGIQHMTVPSSLGFQRYHSGFNIRKQHCQERVSTCNQLAIGWSTRRDQVPNGFIWNQIIHSDLSRGIHFNPNPRLNVGFYGGLSTSVVTGGVDSFVWRPELQLLSEAHVRRRTKRNNHIWFTGGYRMGIYGLSPHIQWGWGRAW